METRSKRQRTGNYGWPTPTDTSTAQPLHLRLREKQARGSGKIIGASTHTVAQNHNEM